MRTEAYIIFCANGLHFPYYEPSNGAPSDLGKQFIAEIPSDPDAFKVWKCAKLEYFRVEEQHPDRARIVFLGALPLNQRPFTTEPNGLGGHAWMFIIDLNTETFSLQSFEITTRTFRLDSIPLSMFASVSHPAILMISPVPQIHMVDSYSFDQELVALYKRSDPRLHSFSSTVGLGHLTLRMRLRQISIRNFLRQYSTMIKRANADSESNNPMFRQLSYGLLNLCNLSTALSLNRFPATFQYNNFIRSGENAIPSWKYPACSEYILNSVIIVLEPRMRVLEFLQAAIGKAISIAKTSPDSSSAMILCLDSVAIVYFTRTGTDGVLTVSHTDNLLFCPAFLDPTSYVVESSLMHFPSAGVDAVIQTFACQVREPCSIVPALFPTELWEQIFHSSIASSQDSLGRTCRFFHSFSQQFPRFDGWTLERLYKNRYNKFVAARNGERRVLRLTVQRHSFVEFTYGYRAILFVDGQLVELSLPLLQAEIRTFRLN